MGILGALSTAVSGLSAQSYALENISGNIANSSTVGFKRVDTSFVDMIPDAPIDAQAAGSVRSYSQLTNTIQGTVKSTGVATNMALSGDGFFAVAQNMGGSTTAPVLSSANLYTRRGDFSKDANGYLVNGAGYYLGGTSYDPASGAATGGATSAMKIPSSPLNPKTTTTISYAGNLPFTPQPSNYSASTPGSELMDPADFGTNPITTGTVVASDQSTFLKESITGGEISVYNSAGLSPTVQTRWAKTDSSTSGGTDTWQLYYQTNSAATGSQVAWKSVGSPITFNGSGTMTSATPLTISALTVNGTVIGDVSLDFSGGLTQYGTSSGEATPTISQNGYTMGTLTNIAVNDDGSVMGNYTNGQSVKVGQITVVHFAGNDGLKRENGGAYSETSESGKPNYGLKATTLSGGAVEVSNTDISEEFSKMIVTQQAYSANTKVMSTAQQMLQDVINILR